MSIEKESLQKMQGRWKNIEGPEELEISSENITLENGQKEVLVWSQNTQWVVPTYECTRIFSVTAKGQLHCLYMNTSQDKGLLFNRIQ